jgi:hypothetical protein
MPRRNNSTSATQIFGRELTRSQRSLYEREHLKRRAEEISKREAETAKREAAMAIEAARQPTHEQRQFKFDFVRDAKGVLRGANVHRMSKRPMRSRS